MPLMGSLVNTNILTSSGYGTMGTLIPQCCFEHRLEATLEAGL
jgi:hypothetical protein